MNAIWVWLRLPWLATLRSQRIFTLVLQLGLVVAAVVAGWLLPPQHGRLQVPLTLLGFACGFWWLFVGSRWLLVVTDAAALRLPRSRMRTGSALAGAVAQTLLVPTLLMACLGAPVGSSALFLADVALMTLLWGLVPRYLVPLFGFMPAAVIGLSDSAGWPSISDPAFAALGAELAVLGLLLVTLRGIQLQRAMDRSYGRWNVPKALMLRGQQGIFEGLPAGKHFCLDGQAARMQSLDVDFSAWGRHGPADPRLACRLVRTVIGGSFAPRRTLIELRNWGFGVIAVLALELAGQALLPRDVLLIVNASILMWTVLMGMLLVPALASVRLAAVFGRQPASEVALLAHLPGLGNAATARRLLLRATLGPSLRRYALAVLALVAAWLLFVGLPHALPVLLAAALTGAVLAGTVMMAALAGRNFEDSSTASAVRRALYLTVLMALVVGSSTWLIPLVLAPLAHKPDGHTWAGQHPWAIAGLALGWSGVLVYALALLRRYWRAFQRRPQPFMHR